MNAAHLHLITAHLPVLGVPFGAALCAVGLFGRSETLWRTGCVALLLAAASAGAPYFSGPGTYDLVTTRYGVPKAPVETHAVAARAASLGLVLLAAVTAAGLLRDVQGDPPSRALRGLILAAAVGIAYGLGYAAYLGGLVRHPELLDGNATRRDQAYGLQPVGAIACPPRKDAA